MIVLGQEMPDLPEGAIATEIILLAKYMTTDGETFYATRSTPALGIIERVGMLEAAAAVARADCVAAFNAD